MTPIARTLKRHRIHQSAVAKHLDVSRQCVWNWVHGRKSPGSRNLLRLVAYLRTWEPGLEPGELLEDTEESP